MDQKQALMEDLMQKLKQELTEEQLQEVAAGTGNSYDYEERFAAALRAMGLPEEEIRENLKDMRMNQYFLDTFRIG